MLSLHTYFGQVLVLALGHVLPLTYTLLATEIPVVAPNIIKPRQLPDIDSFRGHVLPLTHPLLQAGGLQLADANIIKPRLSWTCSSTGTFTFGYTDVAAGGLHGGTWVS